MSEQELRIHSRNLPHWVVDGSVYFVTYRAAGREFQPEERQMLIEHLRSGESIYYNLLAAVVMPDHVHLLIQPAPRVTLSRITKRIKGKSARLINEYRGTRGKVWQDESWDRIVRDAEELEETLKYMAENPVKAGLARDALEYDGWHCHPEFF